MTKKILSLVRNTDFDLIHQGQSLCDMVVPWIHGDRL